MPQAGVSPEQQGTPGLTLHFMDLWIKIVLRRTSVSKNQTESQRRDIVGTLAIYFCCTVSYVILQWSGIQSFLARACFNRRPETIM